MKHAAATLAFATGALIAPCGAWAQAEPAGSAEAPAGVVVSATRSERNAFDVPVSIDRIDAGTIRDGQVQNSLSEPLVRVPGLVVQNRNNYAQDLQVSSRGFGARAQFGVRGVRLYADGIPATLPDGQGQTSSFDLGSAERIEVMRGPFSSLYGNASGGVIQVSPRTAARADPDRERERRQLGQLAPRTQVRRHLGRAELRRRRVALRHRRLPRPQRGDARPGEREAQDRRRRGDARHADRERALAAGAGSAGPVARAGRAEPAPGRSRVAPLRHAQGCAPGAGRRDGRAPPQRHGQPALRRLRRQPQSRAVPVDTA